MHNFQPDRCHNKETHGAMRDNHRKTNYVSIRFHEELVLDSYVKNKELTV
jgi:hypothetical protein